MNLMREGLQQQLGQLSIFVEASAEGILLADEEGIIVLVNRKAEAMFGYQREALIGCSIEILMPQRFRAEHQHQRRSFYHGDHHRPMGSGLELTGQRQDGSEFPLEISLSQLDLRDATLVVAILTDITQRKQLEAEKLERERIQAALEKEREIRAQKEQFFSMASHEFRTPLTIINATSSILERHHHRFSDEELNEKYRRIQTQVTRLDQLVQDILMMSKSEAHKIKVDLIPTHLLKFCLDMIDKVRPQASAAHELVLDLEPNHTTAILDRQITEHILGNLLSNAIKYSPQGGKVELQVARQDGSLTFCVHDQGIGIPANNRHTLFEPFFRADNVDEIQGTGLGLTLVHELVTLLGGEISYQSEEGQGSTFVIRLPQPNS